MTQSLQLVGHLLLRLLEISEFLAVKGLSLGLAKSRFLNEFLVSSHFMKTVEIGPDI
jgi:hypothetical protein